MPLNWVTPTSLAHVGLFTGIGILSACAQVLSSAKSLSSESNRLKQEVQKFLATVRAA